VRDGPGVGHGADIAALIAAQEAPVAKRGPYKKKARLMDWKTIYARGQEFAFHCRARTAGVALFDRY
jgi:hypothetical protein